MGTFRLTPREINTPAFCLPMADQQVERKRPQMPAAHVNGRSSCLDPRPRLEPIRNLLKSLIFTTITISVAVLSAGCGQAPPQATNVQPASSTSNAVASVPASPTPRVLPTQTPSSITTTGDYAADLAALGVVPDNVESFSSFMKDQLCHEAGSSLGVAVRSLGGNSTGGGIEGVRLTVAYFCPKKSQEVETYLKYFTQ